MKYPDRIIKQGEKDTVIVNAIQLKLEEYGCGTFQGSGIFGPKTKAAVRLFQSTHSDQLGNPLEIDGKVGAITWAVLFGIKEVPVEPEASTELLKEVIKAAISQVGIMEEPPGSNRGKRVEEYLSSVGLGPGLFWCAAFIYWCFDKAAKKKGVRNPLVKTGGCLYHWDHTKGKKIPARQAVNNPSLLKPGQIFIINNGGGHGHTGLVEKIEGGFIHTIEGNSNPSGSSNGIGVFRLRRKIAKINTGFIEYR